MWYVYILECKNKALYTGITKDLERRFKQHSDGCGSNYTRAFGAKKILWKEKHPTRSSALKREAQIKSLERKKKLSLIKSK